MIKAEFFKIIELEFPDGSSPPKAIIKEWLRIVAEHFGDPVSRKARKEKESSKLENNSRPQDRTERDALGGQSRSIDSLSMPAFGRRSSFSRESH